MTYAKSIHIGLNHVDPDGYNGWDGELSGCINDATDMQTLADGLGYSSTILIDGDATSCRVISEIGQAANELQSGDILLLSYSGHGGQVDDVNGEEDDYLDETWCLYDRQLVDDELYCLWSRFNPGVRVVVLSDSCHSGTVLRMLKTAEDMTKELAQTRAVPTPEQKATLDAISKTLGLDSKEYSKAVARNAKKATSKSTMAIRPRSASAAAPVQSNLFGVPKRIPSDVQELVNRTHKELYDSAQWMAGPAERASVSATVILISGCQDDQLSMDGSGNGLFTEKVKLVWNDGAFTGNYEEFCDNIKAQMPAKQQPNYFVVGAKNVAFEGQSPFEIGDGTAIPAPSDSGGSEPAPEPGPEPEPEVSGASAAERPVLRSGSRGPAVRELQQLLKDNGYNVSVDGAFGPGTASAVRSFQRDNDLEADGVVGKGTWKALLATVRETEPA